MPLSHKFISPAPIVGPAALASKQDVHNAIQLLPIAAC